jgi:fibronectin type 3 domain-containing protein
VRLLRLATVLTLLGATPVVAATSAEAATRAPVFGYGTPQMTTSAAPSGFDWLKPTSVYSEQDSAGEPSIGANWLSGKALYMSGFSTYGLSFNNATTPPTITWSDNSVPGAQLNLDPILTVEPTTGRAFAGGDTGACSAMFTTTDDGTTWLPSIPCTGTTDHPGVGYSPSATKPGTSVYYYCQQEDLDNCATSTNGLVWAPSVPLNLDCLSLHGHPKGSADGTAYLPNVNCFDSANNPLVGGMKTTDDGATFTGYTIPGATTPASGFDPSVTTTPDNTLYEGWNRAGDYHPVVAVSKTHGDPWAPTVDLAGTVSPPIVASTFPTLVAGDNGRVAYSFIGTQTGAAGVNPFATGFHGIWNIFTSYTYDGGATWTTVKDSATPVQYGEIDAGGTTTSGQRNLLDFMDSTVTKDGRVLVAYADGCLADCEAAGLTGKTTAQADAEKLSTHAYATVAYQSAGKGLFAANDVVLAPTAPTLSGSVVPGANALAWTAPTDNGGAAVTSYQVLRGTSAATLAPLATATGTTYVDRTATLGTPFVYAVKAVNSAGPGDVSNAVTLTAADVPGAPALTAALSSGAGALSWSVPPSNGATITGYQVSRGTAPGAETPLATVSGTSYTDSTVTAGPTYYYTVTAVNSVGSGAPSNEAALTTATAPAATTLAATGGANAITLTWPAAADGGSPVTSYTISRGAFPGPGAVLATVSGSTLTFTDSAVTAGTAYSYTVAATNAVGTGPLSNQVSATAYTTPGAPTLTATGGANQVSLSWTAPATGGSPITAYWIYRGDASGTETLVQTISSGTVYVDPGLLARTTYYYKVAAVNAAGTGALSNEAVATTRRK